jgi:hypothetical protein
MPLGHSLRAENYIKHDWEARNTYEPGKDSVQRIPVVNLLKIFLPPPHVKLGLIWYFVKAVAKTNSEGFQYLSKTFTAKLEGMLVVLQIREILEGEVFVESLDTGRAAWESCKCVCINLLSRKMSVDFSEGNQKLLNAAYKEVGCHMSL